MTPRCPKIATRLPKAAPSMPRIDKNDPKMAQRRPQNGLSAFKMAFKIPHLGR